MFRIPFLLGILAVLFAGDAPPMSSDAVWPPPFDGSVYSATGTSTALNGKHATYNVGPGQTFVELTDVP